MYLCGMDSMEETCGYRPYPTRGKAALHGIPEYCIICEAYHAYRPEEENS